MKSIGYLERCVITSASKICHLYFSTDELPGLAHFLEHMVFMGSKKYPDENAYDEFIQKNGG